MPPAISDDEISDEEVAMPVRGRRTPESIDGEDELVKSESDEANGEEDEEDLEEDEFIVEAIKKHMVDEDGTIKFQVKWEGWEAKTDLTWEPEENLKETAEEVLDEYFEKIGGRDQIFEQSTAAAKGKKRGRPASAAPSVNSKRSKKNGVHPAETPPSATAKKWSPPAGSWEDDIDTIDACEVEGSGKLMVFLLWKNGTKTKHPTSVIYKKCPQKMLQYYEKHIRIIQDENKSLVDAAGD